MPTGYDGRVNGDVLVEDLNSLVFRVSSFKSPQVFGEWDVAFGHRVEVGLGLGYQARTVPSFYRNIVNQSAGGGDILQDLRLRIIPVSAVVRFLPFGKPGHAQPYLGAGIAALRWRYSEFGEFVDANSNIFQARFVGTGTSLGTILLGGVRVPAGGDVFAVNFEARYQFGTGKNLPQPDFLTNKIDLSGGSMNIAFMIRY